MISEPKRLISKKAILKLKDLSAYPFMNLSLTDIAGEEWLDIPQFDGCYLISNYGRIKALPRLIEKIVRGRPTYFYSKERIVKQSLRGFYNKYIKQYTLSLQVRLYFEKNAYSFMVHRLVYELYIDGIDFETDGLKIVHKDGDNLNNKVDNLESSDSTTIFYKMVKNNTRPSRPTHSEKMYNQIGVIQYDLAGNILQHFVSVTEAAKALQTKVYDLKKVLTNQVRHKKGFVLRYETDTYKGEYSNYSKTRKVQQFTIAGELIKIHNSGAEASLYTGVSANTIAKSALHKLKFGGGFVWRYEGEAYNGEFTKTHKKPVCQYEKSGLFVQEFESIAVAAKSIEIGAFAINSCVKIKRNFAGGYVWRYKEDPYNGEYKDIHEGVIPITQLDPEGNVIATFKSMLAAAKSAGIVQATLHKRINSDNPIVKGFVWRVATQSEIDQIPKSILPPIKKRNPSSIRVCQYTKAGEKIASYDSILEATKATGATESGIKVFLKNPNHVHGNFVWRKEGDIYQGELKDIVRKNEAKMVTQYDLEGNKISVFPSSYAAKKLITSSETCLAQVLKGVQKSAGGFIWQYGDGPDKLDLQAYYSNFELISPRSKSVSSYDLDGNKKGYYKSLGEAARQNNIPYISISNTVNGKAKSASKLIWILGDGPDKLDVKNYLFNGEVKVKLV